MAEITGGELILKCLAKENVECIFGISDGAYKPLLAKMADYGMRWVSPRHEAAAVFMAQGYYKTSGRIPVVLAGEGPGAANLISGIISAKEEGVPVIAITGQCRQNSIYPFRSGVHQGVNQYEIFRPNTKWNAVAHSWDRLPEIIRTAYRMATTGRPGPVHIDVSSEIFHGLGDDANVRILDPGQYRAPLPGPSQSQIEQTAELIINAKNPLLIGGTGVLNSGGWSEFVQLVELLNCAATTTSAARGIISDDHPNSLISFGSGAMTARKQADVVLAIGTRLGDLDLPFDPYWADPDKQKIIQVDTDPSNIGVNRPISIGIVADAKMMMMSLVAELKKRMVNAFDGSIVRDYKALQDVWRDGLLQPVKDFTGQNIHPVQSIEAAQRIFPPDAINVADGGNTSLFNIVYSRFTEPRTMLGSFEFGHLGTGISQAIGAKLVNPEKDVYVITGDGAAGFHIMEMETAVREKTKITVLVHAEGSYSMVAAGQALYLGDMSKIVGCSLHPVRWDKIAEGIGCHAEYVDNLEQLPEAIERAKASSLPGLVHIVTDKDATLIPPMAKEFSEVMTGA